MNTRAVFSSSFLAALVLSIGAVDASAGPQSVELLAADGTAGDLFGYSVAISGRTAIIGAPGDDTNGSISGSAYLFDAVTGRQIVKLLADDGEVGDLFGQSVAISGSRAIVGAHKEDQNGMDSGAAYLFDATTGAQIAKLVPADGAPQDWFGFSVAISGTTAIIGSHQDDDNGTNSGSVYLFDTITGLQVAKLLADDGEQSNEFGRAVAISGTTAIVGAVKKSTGGVLGAAYLFDTVNLLQTGKLLPPSIGEVGGFGSAVGIHGTLAIVGALADDNGEGQMSGAAYLYDTDTGISFAKLAPADGVTGDLFGSSVALNQTTAIVGAWLDDTSRGINSGSAYLYSTSSGSFLSKLSAQDGAAGDLFGRSVGAEEWMFLAGAEGHDDKGSGSGSAYVFLAQAVSYCTAGLSANGCQATLSASGSASVSGATGFVISAANVEGAKDGLFFYGTTGRQATPWGSGTSFQCIVPPVKRAGLLTGSGTTGHCDGALSQDFNALWTAKPAQNPGTGAVVQAQLWYRDPSNTSNQTTSLSDAIEFVVGP